MSQSKTQPDTRTVSDLARANSKKQTLSPKLQHTYAVGSVDDASIQRPFRVIEQGGEIRVEAAYEIILTRDAFREFCQRGLEMLGDE